MCCSPWGHKESEATELNRDRETCRKMQVPLRAPGVLGQKAWGQRGGAKGAWLGCPDCYRKGCFKDQDHVTLLLWAWRCQPECGLRAQPPFPQNPMTNSFPHLLPHLFVPPHPGPRESDLCGVGCVAVTSLSRAGGDGRD